MSLCDRCFAPGACCKRFGLFSNEGEPITVWDDEPTRVSAPGSAEPLPFLPLERSGTWEDPDGRAYSSWWWSCPRLQADGRCGDYENRPALCRTFEPAAETLCVHWGGAEGGEADVIVG